MKLYTVREAAEEYFAKNVSMSHIYNLIKTKNLNCIHIGHKILIPENALDGIVKLILIFNKDTQLYANKSKSFSTKT